MLHEDGYNADTLARPRYGRCLAGVAAAAADRLGWSRTGVRVAWLVWALLMPVSALLVYVLGAWILPERN